MVDIGGFAVPTWLCVTVPLLYLLYKYLTPNVDHFKKMGVPYMKPWPLIGNIMAIFSVGLTKFDDSIKEQYGKVVGIFDCMTPTLMVYDLDLLKDICIKHFHNFQNHKSSGITQYPLRKLINDTEFDHWKNIRNQLTPTFSGGKLRRMTDAINQCSRNLTSLLGTKAENKEVVDLKVHMGNYCMDAIAGTAFGIDINSHVSDSSFVRNANKINDTYSSFSLRVLIIMVCPWLMQYIKMAVFPGDTMEFFLEVINQAMKKRGEEETNAKDFMQLMVNAHVDDPKEEDLQTNEDLVKTNKGYIYSKKGLTHEEILAQSFIFFLAGYETVAIQMSWLCYNLACYPEVQEQLHQEIVEALGDMKEPDYDVIKKMPYLQMCFEETIRMYPPAARTDRMCNEDIEIKGIPIKKGTVIGIPIWSIHRDPENYPDPDQFKPERFSAEEKAERHPMAWIPFGQGPRNCVGMRLALVEIKFAIIHILLKFKLVACEETVAPSEVKLEQVRMMAVGGLKIKFEPRN